MTLTLCPLVCANATASAFTPGVAPWFVSMTRSALRSCAEPTAAQTMRRMMPTRMWRMAAILHRRVPLVRVGCRLRAVEGEHMRHHVIAALLGTIAYAWPALAADPQYMTIKMEIDVAR